VHRSLTSLATLALLLVLGLPSVAYANAGLPMLALVLPAGVLSLPLVVVIEGSILHRRLGITRVRAMKLSAVANAVSTLAGVPAAWAVLVGVELLAGSAVWRIVIGDAVRRPPEFWQELLIVILSAPWLVPIHEEPTPWVVPVAMLVLLIPFFFASYFVEMAVVRSALVDLDAVRIRDAMWQANAVTYTLFALTTLAWLGWMLASGAA
jgi:hypothetical protein